MNLFLIILLSVILPYVLIVISMGLFWRKYPQYKLPDQVTYHHISVIIPVRNEAGNICSCLDSIIQQEYPSDRMEVIVVNDHSEDNTTAIVREWMDRTGRRITLLDLPDGISGKKMAIDHGIRHSSAELILTTDADCTAGRQWLAHLSSFYHEKAARMIVGPVAYRKEMSLFDKFQSVDFLAMAGFGAAAFLFRQPIIGNGANLLFEKQAYLAVNGYKGNLSSVSGDDVFLLHKFKKKFPGQICYLKSPQAMVSTTPSANLPDFFNQKIRWASKARYYKDNAAIAVSGMMLLVNALVLTGMIITLLTGTFGRLVILSVLLVKLLADLFFMMPFFTFSGKQKLFLFFFPVQLIYPAYITGIGIFAPFFNFSWKGRKSNFFH